MATFKEKFIHAFALEPEVVVDELPSSLERFAGKVVDKRMETPAILFLEMMRPLNFLGSQFMYAAMPFATLFSGEREMREVAEALEARGTVSLLVNRIEELSRRSAL